MSTLQERLGFSASDRLLITHADDVGMCQATISAWESLVNTGLLSSASTMVPCSWFPYAAEVARKLGGKADLGVHLTLNSERQRYRWGPLTTHDPASGLVDEQGYFHNLARPTHLQGDPTAVHKELAAQIARASQFGVDITHVDSHMLTLYHPALMPVYLDLAAQTGVPTLIPDVDGSTVAQMCVIPLEEGEIVANQFQQAAASGKAVLLASMVGLPFNRQLEQKERLAFACDWLDTRGPGVHVLVGHPADDTPELRTLAPDVETRVADRVLMGSDEFGRAIEARGFKLIGMREIREAMAA
ncbi:polysaccharide deacetylase family protein [Silvimonas amylolytica]|uniref:Carbohydrate deacetylase n=1 Tax=Silvimonas amylolytica TaxID=449663 RepID=A0ABQ2PM56_9NEIS|nr:polysaccharide deacetylase family protein [Silvimonas amylolytica]GGP26455.1 carbohydrate deacetylase [Silvimonas amylolytica]